MKKIIIIIDGWGDKFSVFTKAKTPNMDKIALMGSKTYMNPIQGLAPESGVAQFVILGQSLSKYTGRGPLEALGAGVKLKKNETAIRCNFAKLKKGMVSDIRAKIPDKRTITKLNKIDKNIRIIPTIEYRAVMIVKNINSNNVKNTHPGYIKMGNISRAVQYNLNFKERITGIKSIDDFLFKAEQIMKNRTLVLRGAGSSLPKVKKMKDWEFIGDMPVEQGLAKLLQMTTIHRPKTLKQEIEKTINAKKNVYLQIKSPDFYSHKGNCKGKIKAIEKIDRSLKPLIRLVEENKIIVCITADHATPCNVKVHTSDPVPFIISPYRKRLGMRIQGKDVMKLLN